MRDPFPIPPIPALSALVKPYADAWGMYTLPLHIHEILFSALFYTFVHLVISPWISTLLFPAYYPRHHRGKRVSWDSHVVSLVQATIINSLALWGCSADDERNAMDWQQRIWGYTGNAAFVQSMAAGYFLWDLVVTAIHIDVFGVPVLMHASSALLVYSFGYMPFLNYYSYTFILYELSTPGVNFHWFFDKVDMTGTKAQLYNGILLISTFFLCRLCFGNFQSLCVYLDMFRAVRSSSGPSISALTTGAAAMDPEVMRYANAAMGPLPVWLALLYVVANVTLNGLNVWWFFKMIAAVRKRFEPAAKEKTKEKPQGLRRASTAAHEAITSGVHIGLDTLDEFRKRTVPEIVPLVVEDDLKNMQ